MRYHNIEHRSIRRVVFNFHTDDEMRLAEDLRRFAEEADRDIAAEDEAEREEAELAETEAKEGRP